MGSEAVDLFETELHRAVNNAAYKAEEYTTVVSLIRSGANCSAENAFGLTAMAVALELGDIDLVQVMLKEECACVGDRIFIIIIQRGSAKLLQLLLEMQDGERTLIVKKLSKAYCELRVRNVALTAEVVHVIQYTLVEENYRTDYVDANSKDDGRRRCEHMLECIELIEQRYQTGLFTDIDQMFIFYVRQILTHIFFLKSYLRKLPLLQLQFILAIFLKTVTGKRDLNYDIYTFVVDKDMIMKFLGDLKREVCPVSREMYWSYLKLIMHRFSGTSYNKIPQNIRKIIRDDFKTNPAFETMISSVDSQDCLTEEQEKLLRTLYDQFICKLTSDMDLTVTKTRDIYLYYLKQSLQSSPSMVMATGLPKTLHKLIVRDLKTNSSLKRLVQSIDTLALLTNDHRVLFNECYDRYCNHIAQLNSVTFQQYNMMPAELWNYLLLHVHCSSFNLKSSAPRSINRFINRELYNFPELKKIILSFDTSAMLMNEDLSFFEKCHSEHCILVSQCTIAIRNKRHNKTFRLLYETYYAMRQLYSIRKILSYVDGVVNLNLKQPADIQKSHIQAIKRTLQVMGETIKSTRQTPNITDKLSRIIGIITGDQFMANTKDLRQFFSHDYSLEKFDLDDDHQLAVYEKIQANLRASRYWFSFILQMQNLSSFKRYLARLYRFRSFDQLRDYINLVGTEFKATLIEDFVPQQLKDALALLKHMMKECSLDDLTAQEILEYISDELNQRMNVIRREGTAMGRAIDQFFFLEFYALQPSAQLGKIKEMVKVMFQHTELKERYKLMEKTDFKYVREVIGNLTLCETDDFRRHLWSELWMLLARDSFGGIETLTSKTNIRSDLAEKATLDLMNELELPTDNVEYFKFLNRRLNKYYQNLFVLDNKYRVLKEVIKDKRVKVNQREMQDKVDIMKREDKIRFQQCFDHIMADIANILNRNSDSNRMPDSDRFALEYCMLEVTEILNSLDYFSDNLAALKTLTPVITGRNFRNYLAHDFLAYDGVTEASHMVQLNALYFTQNPVTLYSSKKCDQTALDNFLTIFAMQHGWNADQENFFQLARSLDLDKMEEALQHSTIALEGRDHLLQEVLSIAEKSNIAKIIDHVCNISERRSIVQLYLNYSNKGKVKQKIHAVIAEPNFFCYKLAVKAELPEKIVQFTYSVENFAFENAQLEYIYQHYSLSSIRKLMQLFPKGLLQRDYRIKNTIIHWATLRGDIKLLAFALDNFPSLINDKNAFGETALILALRYHSNDLVDKILDYNAVTCVDTIWAAAYYNNRDFIARLINNNSADASTATHNPLIAAVARNNLDVFKILHIDYGYSVNSCNALHFAARMNRVEIIRHILQYNDWCREEIHRFDDNLYTPLMMACACGHYESTEILLEHGANARCSNVHLYTPLHCASYGENLRIVQLLVEHADVDINAVTRDKTTPLCVAIVMENIKLLEYLLLRKAVITEEHILRACSLNKLHILDRLLTIKPELLETRDFLQRSLLMIAVIQQNEKIVEHLIEKGANVESANNLGMTCLHICATGNNAKFCKKILDAGCNIDATDRFLRTPLIIALENEFIALGNLLLEYGASVEHVFKFRYENRQGATLLHKFSIENRPLMIKFLTDNLNFPTDIVDYNGKTAAQCVSLD